MDTLPCTFSTDLYLRCDLIVFCAISYPILCLHVKQCVLHQWRSEHSIVVRCHKPQVSRVIRANSCYRYPDQSWAGSTRSKLSCSIKGPLGYMHTVMLGYTRQQNDSTKSIIIHTNTTRLIITKQQLPLAVHSFADLPAPRLHPPHAPPDTNSTRYAVQSARRCSCHLGSVYERGR